MNIAPSVQQDVTGGGAGEPRRGWGHEMSTLHSTLLILNSKLIMHEPNKQRSSLADLQRTFSKGGIIIYLIATFVIQQQ